MRDNIKFISFLMHSFLINISCQTLNLPPGSHEFFITEIVRVKRQAGYVYNRPNIPFELPTQVPIVSTQAPNVDRTQAQHMFYAYPAPAPGGTKNTGYTAGAPTSTSSNDSGSSGYNYGSQGATGGSQTIGLGQNQNSATETSGSSGYSYNAQSNGNIGGQSTSSGTGQITTNTGSTATSSVSSTYRYDAPAAKLDDKSESSGSITASNQQGNSVTSQSTGSISTGYDYNGPQSDISPGQNSGNVQAGINSGVAQYSGAVTSGYSNSVSENTGTNSGQNIAGTPSSQTGTSSVNSSYRYDAPVLSNTGQTSTISGSSQPTGSITRGYNYNDPVHSISITGQTNIGGAQISTNVGNGQGATYSDNSGYNINAPSPFVSNTAQVSRNPVPPTSSSTSTATSSVSTSYRYEAPKQTGSNQGASIDVSTNAPRYLPPIIEGNVNINNRGNTGSISANSGSSSGSPSSTYVPPTITGTTGPPPDSPSQTYIPSSNKTPQSLASTCVGPDCAGSSVSRPSSLYATVSGPSNPTSYSSGGTKQSNPPLTQPSNTYVPPIQPSGFVPAQPSNSYIPTNTGSTQIAISKPGQAYLLPQGSPGPVQPRPPGNQPTQTYITPNNVVNNPSIGTSPTSNGSIGPTVGPAPNANYLPPNTVPSVSPHTNNANSSPNNNYLPPKQTSSNQQSFFNVPAASYLPPVF